MLDGTDHQELTKPSRREAGPRRIYNVPRPKPVGRSQGDLEHFLRLGSLHDA